MKTVCRFPTVIIRMLGSDRVYFILVQPNVRPPLGSPQLISFSYHAITGWTKGVLASRLLWGGFDAAVGPKRSIPTKDLSSENLGLRLAQKCDENII
jgi:hypothetical protein